MTPRSREILLTTLAAVAYAALAFAVHLRWYPLGDLGVESDFYAELVVSAQRLAAGEFAVANYPFKGPLYSFVLVAVHAAVAPLGADWYRAAVLLNALAAAATLVVSFGLLRRLFPRPVAAAATLALAGTYEFFLHAHKASSDLLALLLHTATVAALIGARGRRRLLAAGALAGLVFLTRYSGAVLAPAGLALAAWLPAGTVGARARAARAGLFLAGFVLVAAPWLAFNQAQSGRLLDTGNLTNVVQDFYGGERREEIPPGGFGSLAEVVAHDPAHFATHLLGNVPRHLWLDLTQLVGWWLWPLAVAGLLTLGAAHLGGPRDWAARRRLDRPQAAFLGVAVLVFFSLCLVFHRVRFSLPLAIAWWAVAYGMIVGWRGAPGRRERAALAVVVVVVSGLQIHKISAGERFYRERLPVQVLAQAPEVRRIAAETGAAVLLARKPHLAHYAGLGYRAYPGRLDGLEEFLAAARALGADLIAVGPWELETFPEAVYLPRLDAAAGVARVGRAGDVDLFRLDRSLPPARAAALPAVQAARERMREAGAVRDVEGYAVALARMARELIILGEWDDAAAALEAGRAELAPHLDAVPSEVRDDLLLSLAFCRLGQERYAEGVTLLGEDLEALGPAPDESWQAVRHTVLARLLAGAGRTDGARRHFQAALALHRRAGRTDEAREAAASLRALEAGGR